MINIVRHPVHLQNYETLLTAYPSLSSTKYMSMYVFQNFHFLIQIIVIFLSVIFVCKTKCHFDFC